MELLLLLVILPAVQDQNHTREWLKNSIKAWCSAAAWLLDLRSYLFGDVPLEPGQEVREEEEEEEEEAEAGEEPPHQDHWNEQEEVQPGGQQDLGAAHHALLQRGPTGSQPYNKPTYFPLRVSEICGTG